MARKKRETEIDDLDGTVEGLARDRFEQEKAAYEERTGETVKFVPPVPVTRTPVKPVGSGQEEESTTPSSEADATPPIQEGSQESESEAVTETEGEGNE